MPQVLTVRRHLHQQSAGVVVDDALEGIYTVERTAPAHLHKMIDIALAVSHQTSRKVGVFVAIAMETLCPVEVLGISGECQHDERRQQCDSFGCFHIE